jgi:hypothetical protein
MSATARVKIGRWDWGLLNSGVRKEVSAQDNLPGQSIRVVGPVVRHCEEEEEEEEEVYSSERSCAQVKEPNKRSGGSPR